MDTSIIVPSPGQVNLESGNSLGMEPGKLYKIISSVAHVGRVTYMLNQELLRGPLMYLRRETSPAKNPHAGLMCALFLSPDGVTLWLTEYVLVELLTQQLIIAAAANSPPHA